MNTPMPPTPMPKTRHGYPTTKSGIVAAVEAVQSPLLASIESTPIPPDAQTNAWKYSPQVVA